MNFFRGDIYFIIRLVFCCCFIFFVEKFLRLYITLRCGTYEKFDHFLYTDLREVREMFCLVVWVCEASVQQNLTISKGDNVCLCYVELFLKLELN